MDYFALFLDVLCIAGQGVMHVIFASRSGRKSSYIALTSTLH